MWNIRTTALLCVSLAPAAPALADEPAPFVTQLRLPARDATLDTFAWRHGDDVLVTRADLEQLSIQAPPGEERVPLSSVPGVTFAIDDSASAVVLTCTAQCFAVQRLATDAVRPAQQPQSARGAYVNYDADVQWIDGDDLFAAGVAEGAAFAPWGLLEASWIGASGGDVEGLQRLETRFTVDYPDQQVRLRLGDSTTLGATGAPMRFAGVQLGRHFGLSPSMITHPSLMLDGEAEAASTVELYVDGALRAREQIDAGPFAFDNSPLVTGAGVAELIVTDITGRQQIISRPFFVSLALLRPGLSDWTLSAGAERLEFGRESAAYGDRFMAGRYRFGVTRNITAEAGVDMTDDNSTVQAGATAADITFGQFRLAHAEGTHGGATEGSWLYQASRWSVGLQAEVRDPAFTAVGIRENTLLRSTAAHFSLNLERYGALSFVGAAVDEIENGEARTYALAYSPEFSFGSLTARLMYTVDEDEDELSFGLHFALQLNDDVSQSFGYEIDDHGATYRASAQRTPSYGGGDGWRARAVAGRQQRLELSGSRRGRLGESLVQIARADEDLGARVRHSGSVGMIEGYRFAARPIRGAFALVDTGAPDVSVARDNLDVGETGRDGRVIATGLRPYDSNAITIMADDLPLDRAPSFTEMRVAPREGAGVVVRFAEATQQMVESQARLAAGGFVARGDVMVRARDGARFPVGANGRITLMGAAAGDVLRLTSDQTCQAIVGNAARGLVFECAGVA